MLVDHLGKLEKRLRNWTVAEAATPAELLMGEFCQPMFGSELSMGAGRIVDCNSKPDAQHAAADIVLCRSIGPRLEVDGLSDCMLAESVVAAILVLPVLDLQTMSAAVARAQAIKLLRRSALLAPGVGLTEPASSGPAENDAACTIACLVVAFEGPQDMGQAHIWLKSAYRAAGIAEPDMPDSGAERQRIASPAIDGVFVLGRGHLNFDNMPLSYFNDEARKGCIGACWSIASADEGSLLSLFLQIDQAATALAGSRLDPRPYLRQSASVIVRLGN